MKISHLAAFKQKLLDIHTSVGVPTLEIPKSAASSISGRRSLYAVQNITKGEQFTHENIKSVRPGYGLHPKYLDKLIGINAPRSFCKGDRLTEDLLPD